MPNKDAVAVVAKLRIAFDKQSNRTNQVEHCCGMGFNA
jgi:hypothetical protein